MDSASVSDIFRYAVRADTGDALKTSMPKARSTSAASSVTLRQRATLRALGLFMPRGWSLCQCRPLSVRMS